MTSKLRKQSSPWSPCGTLRSACRARITARWPGNRSTRTSSTPCWRARRSAEVVVDTDSPVIMDGLQRDYPQVRVIERPEHLRADTIPMNEILLHDTAQVPADLYLQTHSTNPLLRAETISAAIQRSARQLPRLRFALFGDAPADAPVGSAGAADQPQPGHLAAHPGSAAGLHGKFLHVPVHPPDAGAAPQPPGRAAVHVRDRRRPRPGISTRKALSRWSIF